MGFALSIEARRQKESFSPRQGESPHPRRAHFNSRQTVGNASSSAPIGRPSLVETTMCRCRLRTAHVLWSKQETTPPGVVRTLPRSRNRRHECRNNGAACTIHTFFRNLLLSDSPHASVRLFKAKHVGTAMLGRCCFPEFLAMSNRRLHNDLLSTEADSLVNGEAKWTVTAGEGAGFDPRIESLVAHAPLHHVWTVAE